MARAIVALVGRPNVGKSTLFNRLIGERKAIVEDLPGTTRDRLYGDTDWNGQSFIVVDTAGLLFGPEDEAVPLAEIARRAREQAEVAIAEADLIVMLVDTREGLSSADVDVAEVLRRTDKPVVLAANKADNKERKLNAVEFYALNLGDPIPISAYHGDGVGDLLDRVVELLPAGIGAEADDESVRMAIVGRPNVGKSSLLNKLLGQQRSVVSEVPGTTRDAIDTQLTVNGQQISLIDTAGIRRRGRIEQGIEEYSVLRALRSIERCDVAILLIDAVEGVTAQDTHIAGMILEQKKGVVIVINKWDLIVKDNDTFESYKAQVQREFNFLSYAPLLFISTLTAQRIHEVLPTALQVAEERYKRVPTNQINDMLRQAVADHPPPSTIKGGHLRLYYGTQAGVAPPTFVFFANNAEILHWSYRRYLENRIRERWGFLGTPLNIVFRSREEKT